MQWAKRARKIDQKRAILGENGPRKFASTGISQESNTFVQRYGEDLIDPPDGAHDFTERGGASVLTRSV
jgi:hypothetical protein